MAACGTIGDDGREAGAQIVLSGAAKFFQLVGCGKFGDFAFADVLLQPVNPAADGHTVPDVCFFHIGGFHAVFDGLGQMSGVILIQNVHILGDRFFQSIVGAGSAQQYGTACRKGSRVSVNIIVGAQFHTVFFQLTAELIAEGLFLGEQDQLSLGQRQIGEHNGIAGYVVAADVQQPCNVIKGSEQEIISFFLRHGAAHVCNFFISRFAGIFQIKVSHAGSQERAGRSFQMSPTRSV